MKLECTEAALVTFSIAQFHQNLDFYCNECLLHVRCCARVWMPMRPTNVCKVCNLQEKLSLCNRIRAYDITVLLGMPAMLVREEVEWSEDLNIKHIHMHETGCLSRQVGSKF